MDVVRTINKKPITPRGKGLGWDYIRIETFKTYKDDILYSHYDVYYYVSENSGNSYNYRTIWKVHKGVNLKK